MVTCYELKTNVSLRLERMVPRRSVRIPNIDIQYTKEQTYCTVNWLSWALVSLGAAHFGDELLYLETSRITI